MKVSEQTLSYLESLGERIRQARIACNLSQVELGDRIGVTRYTVGALEGGRAKVAVGTVFEAALAVGLPVTGEPRERLMTSESMPPENPAVKLDDDYF